MSSKAIRACPRPLSRRRSWRSNSAGSSILIVSLRHPTDRAVHPVHDAIGARPALPAGISVPASRRASGAAGGARAGNRAIAAARRAWLADLRARSDPEPGAPLWSGAGAGGRAAERCRSSARAFSAHAGIGRALRRADARTSTGRCRRMPRTSGRLPTGRKREKLGEARWAVTCTAAGHAHLAELGASAGAGRAVLSRARSRTLLAAATAAARRRRQRSGDPGRAAVGRPGGREEGL